MQTLNILLTQQQLASILLTNAQAAKLLQHCIYTNATQRTQHLLLKQCFALAAKLQRNVKRSTNAILIQQQQNALYNAALLKQQLLAVSKQLAVS